MMSSSELLKCLVSYTKRLKVSVSLFIKKRHSGSDTGPFEGQSVKLKYVQLCFLLIQTIKELFVYQCYT